MGFLNVFHEICLLLSVSNKKWKQLAGIFKTTQHYISLDCIICDPLENLKCLTHIYYDLLPLFIYLLIFREHREVIPTNMMISQ